MFNWFQKRKPVSYPSPEDWGTGSANQLARVRRMFSQLEPRQVPVYDGPLFVDDDDDAQPQSAQDVARRALVLWAVELQAEGVPYDETHAILDNLELWPFVSHEEKEFLNEPNPDPAVCQKLIWRLESIWVLMWSLEHIETLDWPSGMCDVPRLVALIDRHEKNGDFISTATLRPVRELLDAQELTRRIHWAIRDAYLNQGASVPEDLDWSGNSKTVPVTASAAVGVVEQRHYVLNWIVNYPSPKDWDSVETPT